MARVARVKVVGAKAWYHLVGKVAGEEGDFQLSRPGAARRLVEIIKHYATGYYCNVAAFCILGNHYHLVLRFDRPRPLSDDELRAKAEFFYPHWPLRIAAWGPQDWARFARRLFDVSEFMRNVQQEYARWHNRRFHRRGHFWSERFRSTLLDGGSSVADCMLYVELNAVRAGLVDRPEDWQPSSLHLRETGQGDWLVPLAQVFGSSYVTIAPGRAATGDLAAYKARLYYRGRIPTREGQARIPAWIVQAEQARGFRPDGVYLKRLRYFTDGLVLAGYERIETWLSHLRAAKRYLRRRHPIPQLDGLHHTLREQRRQPTGF